MLHQGPALLFIQGVGLQLGINRQSVQHHRDHTPGQQVRQSILHGAVFVHLQIPQYTLIQFALIQSRLQIDDQPAALPLQVGAGAEDRRTGNTKMGKQQLSKIGKQHFPLGADQLNRNISQTQALHLGAIRPCLQRYQRAFGFRDTMPQFFGKRISVTGRPGGGIGQTTGGQYHFSCPVNILPCRCAGDNTALCQDLRHPAGADCHTAAAHFPL